MRIKNKDLDQLIIDVQGAINHINYMQEDLDSLKNRIGKMQTKLIEIKNTKRFNDPWKDKSEMVRDD